MSEQSQSGKDSASDTVWLYMLAGYVVGFSAAHVLNQYGKVGRRAGAFFGGLRAGFSGRSLGDPWHVSQKSSR